ncbi:hypothetical protein G9A89_021755 [Geosiphon pyriformis]|nr:hypothetical protein G9A89_021755 [Geosiphon pyriformis]
MDLKTASGGNMSKKKTLKEAFHVVLGNIKHFSDEKDISLSNSGPDNSVYSDVNSLSGDDENVSMAGIHDRSLLDLAATTLKAKCINIGAVFGSPDFTMDDDEIIIKTPIEVSVKKSFALDIDISAVENKLVTAKTQLVRKKFSTINGFGRATTPSKFEKIIRSTFTSEKSMNMATSLAREKGISVNTNLKKQSIHSDWAVIIKEIPMDTPKEIIITAVSEFGDIKSIRTIVEFASSDQAEQLASRWSFLIGKNSVNVAMAASKNWFRALLFTLPVRTMAHDLGTLLDKTGGKTCMINCSVNTGNRIYCAVIGFESEEDLESAYYIEPIFSGVKLSWARIDLCDATITSFLRPVKLFKKDTSEVIHFHLAKLYVKKNVLISRLAAFGGRSWAQVVLAVSTSHNHSAEAGSGFFPIVSMDSDGKCLSITLLNSSLDAHFPLTSVFQSLIPVLSAVVDSSVDLDMVLNIPDAYSAPSSPATDDVLVLSSSSTRVLTSKVGSLKSKLVVLKASVGSKVAMCNVRDINIPAKQEDFERIRIFLSGLDKGFLRAGMTVIMNNSLACHVSKVEEVPGCLILVWLFFKSKLSVTFVDLYAGVSAEIRFGLVLKINSLIAKAVNSSSFVVLGEDFNKNRSKKNNSKGTLKVIDFIFVSNNLASAVASHFVDDVSEFFNTNHKSISVSVGLDGLLNTCLNSACKQANKNQWKFKLGNANKELSLAGLLMYSNKFQEVKDNSNLNAMWKVLSKTLVHAADVTFSSGDLLESDKLVKIWLIVDIKEASKFSGLVLSGIGLLELLKHLSIVKKEYWKFKYYKLKASENTVIKKTIDCYIENFCSDKGRIIKSVLECPFCKVILDYLVMNNKLVFKSGKVKLKINKIMKEWMKKWSMLLQMPNLWFHQYMLLDYVDNNAFTGVMKKIDMEKLSLVVGNLLNEKTASGGGCFGKE